MKSISDRSANDPSNSTIRAFSTSMTSNTSNMTHVSSELGISLPGYIQLDHARALRLRRELASGGFGMAFISDALSNELRYTRLKW